MNSRIFAPISSAGFGTTTTLFAMAAWASANTASISADKLPAGGIAGVQCKKKRQWPVAQLTTKDIDDEVAEALKFEPPLSEFTIATTAPNDAKLRAHVDAITERHKAQGLFTVHLLGWSELWRRITDHPQLGRKALRLRCAIFDRRQDRRDSRGDPACR
jgi:hypothetical protein